MQVAKFVGVATTRLDLLPPEILGDKWISILRSAQRSVLQIPPKQFPEKAYPGRDRSIRHLCHHIFRIAEAYLETAIDSVPVTAQYLEPELRAGTFNVASEHWKYGDDVVQRLQQWRDTVDDNSLERLVPTFFGSQSLHHLLERFAGHSAQHARQLNAILNRLGIEPTAPLKAEDLAGLPLSKGIWE